VENTLPCRPLTLCVLGVCLAATACSSHHHRIGDSPPEPPEQQKSLVLYSVPFDPPEEQLLREFKDYYGQFRNFNDNDIPISEEAIINRDYRECATAFNNWLSYVVATVRERNELASAQGESNETVEYSQIAHAVSDALDKLDHDRGAVLHLLRQDKQLSDRRNRPHSLGYRIIDRYRGCNKSAAEVVANELSEYRWDGAPFLD